MSSKSNLPEGLSQADVDFLVANPGETLGGAVGGAPEAFKPSSSINIHEPAARGVRPQIGGHISGKERISRPSPNLPARLAAGDEERRALEEARRVERETLQKETDPLALAKQVAYLTRQLKKLSQEIKSLKESKDG